MPPPGRAGDLERPAQRLDAVATCRAARPARRPGRRRSRRRAPRAAGVVAAVPDLERRRAGVLDRVGQRLGDDEVGRPARRWQVVAYPDRRRRADGQPVGEVFDRRSETVLDQPRRASAPGRAAELVDRAVERRRARRLGPASTLPAACSRSRTSRPWMPSCRSRAMARRSASAASVTRARDARSSATAAAGRARWRWSRRPRRRARSRGRARGRGRSRRSPRRAGGPARWRGRAPARPCCRRRRRSRRRSARRAVRRDPRCSATAPRTASGCAVAVGVSQSPRSSSAAVRAKPPRSTPNREGEGINLIATSPGWRRPSTGRAE